MADQWACGTDLANCDSCFAKASYVRTNGAPKVSLDCRGCGEHRQAFDFIKDSIVISKILTHLGIVQEVGAPPFTLQTELSLRFCTGSRQNGRTRCTACSFRDRFSAQNAALGLAKLSGFCGLLQASCGESRATAEPHAEQIGAVQGSSRTPVAI